MRRRLGLLLVVFLTIGLVGCIVSDSITTITIRPDGSADVVLFQSNVRSSESGARGEQELRQYVEAFDAARDQEQTRLREAGGEIVEALWIRRDAPCSNWILARLPGPPALERYFSISGPDGTTRLKSRFVQEGDLRRLVLELLPSKDFALPKRETKEEVRRQQADGISATRIAVTGGTIVRASGFAIAADRRSALLDLDEIVELLAVSPRRVELMLEWRVEK